MKVSEIMNRNVPFCSPETDLSAVAELMWRNDCGVLPVMDGHRLDGVISDHDVWIALGARALCSGAVTAGDVANPAVFTCAPSDDVHQVLKTMRTYKVRQLPVLNGDGSLEGMLSLNEVILWEHKATQRPGDMLYDDVVVTLEAIYGQRAARLSAGG